MTNYWRDVTVFCDKLDGLDLTPGEKIIMHSMYAIQGKVIEARKNKPFEEWTFDDMLNSFSREVRLNAEH